MYEVGVTAAFTARHALVGGDYGAELLDHAHDYRVEVALEGPALGADGFLVDITALRRALAAEVDAVAGRRLNDLPAFAGLNPSVESFARILAEALGARLRRQHPGAGALGMRVTLWEADDAWASYRLAPAAAGRA